ncbi:hypothetical protein, partial [Campylobacter upsaliensis]
ASELAEKLGILKASITEWHKYKYPNYLEMILNYAIEVRVVKLIEEKNDDNAFLKEEIALYEKANLFFEGKIKELKLSFNKKNKIINETCDSAMKKEEFKALLKECGFRGFVDLAFLLHLNPQSIVQWNRYEKYPKYLKQFLKLYISIKNYKENTLSIEELKEENSRLKAMLEKNKSETLYAKN